jgi:hypothetical protein
MSSLETEARGSSALLSCICPEVSLLTPTNTTSTKLSSPTSHSTNRPSLALCH